ncbi:MAG: 4Fe-4S dicluster domain-containing protein [Deltaproteobacteria bacterium]|nr:4Fe-4S dicluster domain-containing protein [Deltaproteobacteria bacterium]
MKQLAFSFDISRCSGCYACVVACQDQNDFTGNDVAFRHVTLYEEGEYPSARILFISTSCFHCGDAPCLMVCPTGAIFRIDENGIIVINRDLCIGCHSCELACPFGAPKFAEDRKMVKCDMCSIRMEHHMAPACVRACPSRAIDVGSLEEISRRKSENASIKILKSLVTARPA